MSHDARHETTNAPAVDFGKLMGPALVAALVGLGGCALAFVQNRELFFQSWLYGFMFWVCLTLGCFGLTVLHHTVKGSWGLSVLRLYEAGGGPTMILVMGALFAPIVLGLHSLYHWTHKEEVAKDIILQHKVGYLNEPFFIARAVAYFLVFALISYVLRSSSLRQDRTLDPGEAARRTTLSAPTLVFFVVFVTFAVTDWVMSLDPHWFSTIFGGWFVVGMGLAALAFGTLIVASNAGAKPYVEIVSPKLTRDLGNLMFAFTMLWAYFTLSQFLITWSGNLPEFTTYYYRRGTQAGTEWWNYLGAFNVVCQWLIPFLLLLSPRVKRTTSILWKVALWILVMRAFDLYWNIIPFFGRGFSWTDVAAFVGIGGVWLAVFASQVKNHALLPAHDTRLQEDLAHEH